MAFHYFFKALEAQISCFCRKNYQICGKSIAQKEGIVGNIQALFYILLVERAIWTKLNLCCKSWHINHLKNVISLLVSHPEEVSSLTDEQSIRLRSHTDVVGIQKELILLWSRESDQHESRSSVSSTSIPQGLIFFPLCYLVPFP